MQVATLFRESATLLGATMDGVKMPVFTEAPMKQESANDDGYETSVDQLDRQHIHSPLPQMQPNMQLMQLMQPHHVVIEPRLLIHPNGQLRMNLLDHVDNRLSSGESLDNEHLGMNESRTESRMSPGQESRESHMSSIETRLSSHDSMEGINSISTRIPSHESHMSSCESQMGHENHMENRLENHVGMEHMGNLDKRISHELINQQEARVRRDNHLVPHDNQIGLENHLNNMERLSRDMNNMENRIMAHENHLNNMGNHEMGHHDGRIPMDHLGNLDRESMMNHHTHGNHIPAHMGHLNPHEHMQQHPQMHMHHPHHPHAHHVHHPHHPHPHGPHGHPHPHLKCDNMEDPYSFVDEETSPNLVQALVTAQPRPSPIMLQPTPKKRGRKRKIKPEDGIMDGTMELLKKEDALVKPPKERKKHDRFNGMPEEEVIKRTLPDHLAPNLDIVIIGINPGMFAAYKGHHYAGPGNHFWKCLFLSGLTPQPMTAEDDSKLLQVGIGFTNMVARATKGSADLTRKEIKEGSQILLEKLQKYKPKIAVFNGKLIYEVFSGNKDFNFGRQPEFVEGTNTYMWVMPSSSARCAQLPRAADKVPFYVALKKFRDYLNGVVTDLDDSEVVFSDQKMKTYYESDLNGENKDERSGYFPLVRRPGELSEVKKEPFDPNRPEKKKRGRPKKIRVEGEEPPPPKERVKREKPPVDSDAPKKKRGRPKKIKTEDASATQGQQTQGTQPTASSQPQPQPPGGALNVSEHTNSSNQASSCFSPPIQSPTGFCQGFSPAYASQAQVPQFKTNHPSPIPAHFSQSPPPASRPQSFTHSDLSSEISAAISSEHLGSPPPTSPSLAPADFEPPEEKTMSKEDPENTAGTECRFSSPAPSAYRGFSDSDIEKSQSQAPQFPRPPATPEFPKRAQDVASKSLSGLESLVDQIPNIADNSVVNSSAAADSFENPQSSQYDYEMSYPGAYSSSAPAPTPQPYPHYTTSTNYSSSGYLPPTQSNFSVSSLANSDAQVASSFSVTSLASNYSPTGYPNLMGTPHLMVPQPGLFPNMPPNYQYPAQYAGAPGTFPYSPALHVPSPNYPPYAPYSNSSYPQPYLPNHVLDRIKQERMDIGFGGF